jgi:hypothetical protein
VYVCMCVSCVCLCLCVMEEVRSVVDYIGCNSRATSADDTDGCDVSADWNDCEVPSSL